LIAVGIKQKVLDHKVCYDYWADTLMNGVRDAKPVIDWVRKRPKNKYTYSDLLELNAKWSARKAKTVATGQY
jgi:hypothetical protein